MAINKAVSSSGFLRYGTATIRNNNSTGRTAKVDKWNTVGYQDLSFDPTGYAARSDYTPLSWATSGTDVRTTGFMLFDADVNGGAIRDTTLANRGPATIYVTLNATSYTMSGAFPLASGESIKYDQQTITSIGVRSDSLGVIAAQGLYQSIIR